MIFHQGFFIKKTLVCGPANGGGSDLVFATGRKSLTKVEDFFLGISRKNAKRVQEGKRSWSGSFKKCKPGVLFDYFQGQYMKPVGSFIPRKINVTSKVLGLGVA